MQMILNCRYTHHVPKIPFQCFRTIETNAFILPSSENQGDIEKAERLLNEGFYHVKYSYGILDIMLTSATKQWIDTCTVVVVAEGLISALIDYSITSSATTTTVHVSISGINANFMYLVL